MVGAIAGLAWVAAVAEWLPVADAFDFVWTRFEG